MFPADLTIAIITFNALETHLPRAIAAARRAGCPAGQLLVIDVASTDGTGLYMLRDQLDLTYIALPQNRGPNPARNRALREATTPYVLLMDVDVELTPGAAELMRDLLHRDPSIGIVTPVVVYSDRPEIINYARTWLHFLGEASATHQDRPAATLGQEPYDVGACTGCAPMIRRDAALAIGLYDERLFFGKTDGDFAYRMTAAGHRIVELSGVRVLHHLKRRGSKYFDHQIANRWYFLLKNYEWRTLVCCAPALLAHELAVLLFVAGKGDWGSWWRGVKRFATLYPDLQAARAQVRRRRRVRDVDLLRGSNLITPIRPESSGLLAASLKIYEAALRLYWRGASALLRRVTG